jgi:hypothetical protein
VSRYPFCYPQSASQRIFRSTTEAGDGDRTRTKSLEGGLSHDGPCRCIREWLYRAGRAVLHPRPSQPIPEGKVAEVVAETAAA